MAPGWIKLPSGYIRVTDHFAKPEVLKVIADAARSFARSGRMHHPPDEEPEYAFSIWFLEFVEKADRLEELLNPERRPFQHSDLKGYFAGPTGRFTALSRIRISLDAALKWAQITSICDRELSEHAPLHANFPTTLMEPKTRWWQVTELAADDLMKQCAAKTNYGNFDRDKWLYEQRLAERTWSDIEQELEDKQAKLHPDWGLVGESGMRTAVHTYCKKSGLSFPKGKPGPPKRRDR